jgi:hypothetical protein
MRIGDIVYFLYLSTIGAFLVFEPTRNAFEYATNLLPQIMGFFKFVILATSGELLLRRIKSGKWSFKGINIISRAFVWGIIGVLISYVFPIFSAGTKFIISSGKYLPVFSESLPLLNTISTSFWISLITNVFFGFGEMIFYSFADTLIDEGMFWKKWHFVYIWKKIDWDSMFGVVFPSIFWFWLPMHTITFSLPYEYQVLMAAALGIALGIILTFAKLSAKKKVEEPEV